MGAMAVSLQAAGILCLTYQGLNRTCMLILTRLLRRWGLPYFRLMGLTHLITALAIGGFLVRTDSPHPAKHQVKWVILRGSFGAGAFIAQILAVRAGADAGDVAALSCVNTVVAALLGRAFLSEPFYWVHAASLCFTLGGAALIAQPEFLFGQPAASGSAWIGYVLGPVSGFFYAGSFICSRKATEASVWHLTFSVVVQTMFVLLVLPSTPFVQDFPLGAMIASPGLAGGMFVFFLALTVAGWLTLCAGAKWCPAAVCATTNTTACMVASYAAQTVLFGSPPKLLTLAGAGLMLAAVVAVAVARVPTAASSSDVSQPASATTPRVGDSSTAGVGVSAAGTVPEDESLASFIAAEYVDVAPHEASSQPRKRRPAGSQPEPNVMGVVASAL